MIEKPRPISEAPRDGTRILIWVDPGECPFVGYWGTPYRYTGRASAWIGHEYGLMDDQDLYRWIPLPEIDG
jgi:hypothetical protein